jgi:serine phosphatase RsbU (regulator of sigma subunit)
LLFYTDGIIDAAGPADRFGETRLRARVAAAPAEPELLVREIELALEEFETGERRDDAAMLAAQLLPRGAGAVTPPRAVGHTERG